MKPSRSPRPHDILSRPHQNHKACNSFSKKLSPSVEATISRKSTATYVSNAKPYEPYSPTRRARAKMSTKTPETQDPSSQAEKKAKIPFIVQYFDPQIRAKDPSGRDLDDIITYSDNQISRKHDFIQYLFPLPEESMVNPWAPLITKKVYEAFRDRTELRAELLQVLLRMLEFYGFTVSASDGDGAERKIIAARNFNEQSKYSWRRSMDHNHLRLTRIIRCLRVLSCEKEAQALYHALLEHDTDNVVRSSSKMFWGRAANRPLWLPPDEPDDDAEGIRWLRQVADGMVLEGAATDETAQGTALDGSETADGKRRSTTADGFKAKEGQQKLA